MTEVLYQICDLKSGDVLADLSLAGDDEFHNTVARVDTTSFTLNTHDRDVYDPIHAPDDPVTWHQSLAPGPRMIIRVDGNAITHGWAIGDITIGDTVVPISAATLEDCFAHSYLDDDVTGSYDETDVIVELLTKADVAGRFGFTIDATPTGRVSDVDYQATENAPIYDLIYDRMTKVVGAAEWRITLAWRDATRRSVEKIIEIADQIGIVREHAIFDRDIDPDGKPTGTIETYTRTISRGPTRLVGSTDGSSPITADPQTADDLIDAGWPEWTERVTFTDISEDDPDPDATLAARVTARLSATKTGIVIWTVTGNAYAPRPGTGFMPGDTVKLQVAPRIPEDPTGGNAWVRVLGYKLNRVTGVVSLELWEDASAG